MIFEFQGKAYRNDQKWKWNFLNYLLPKLQSRPSLVLNAKPEIELLNELNNTRTLQIHEWQSEEYQKEH